jgi:plasmid stabilization system protein ParE
MASKFSIEITSQALEDLEEISVWMKRNISHAAAAKWFRDIFKAILALDVSPQHCPVAAEGLEYGLEIRQRSRGKRRAVHRIVFCIVPLDKNQAIVRVLRVVHSARKQMRFDELGDVGSWN